MPAPELEAGRSGIGRIEDTVSVRDLHTDINAFTQPRHQRMHGNQQNHEDNGTDDVKDDVHQGCSLCGDCCANRSKHCRNGGPDVIAKQDR